MVLQEIKNEKINLIHENSGKDSVNVARKAKRVKLNA